MSYKKEKNIRALIDEGEPLIKARKCFQYCYWYFDSRNYSNNNWKRHRTTQYKNADM